MAELAAQMDGRMRISLTLEAILAKYAPENPKAYEIPGPLTVEELIHHLGIPEDLVMFVIVNGQMAPLKARLQDNASVSMCPYICGG
jgi:sulfur carrier protein ThiS